MKKYPLTAIFLMIFMEGFVVITCSRVYAQHKKYKARLSLEIHKMMGEATFLQINAKYKGEKGYQPASGLHLNIYRELNEDSLNLQGSVVTDKNGGVKFLLKIPESPSGDSLVTYKFLAKVENDPEFKDTKKSVRFQNADLTSEVIKKDSVNYIYATLSDALGNPVEGEKLKVMVHRLYAPLTIGKSSYKTDENGSIMVPIKDPPPGINGVLNFEVLLDSRKYGLISNVFSAPVGKIIVDKSTFDKRTMWSPRNKTPLFLWIFPNFLIFSAWFVIVLIIINLIKIYKS